MRKNFNFLTKKLCFHITRIFYNQCVIFKLYKIEMILKNHTNIFHNKKEFKQFFNSVIYILILLYALIPYIKKRQSSLYKETSEFYVKNILI